MSLNVCDADNKSHELGETGGFPLGWSNQRKLQGKVESEMDLER